MANKKKKSTKVDGKMAFTIIALTVVLAVLVAAAMALGGLPEKPGGETTPLETAPTGDQTQPTVTDETLPQNTIQVTEQIPGSYEQWLAAAMVMGVSLEYPDFADIEVFAPTDTPLADKMTSGGVYVRFVSGGETVLLHALPIAQVRSEPGTRDLSSMQIGYASLSAVEEAPETLSDMHAYTLEDLSDYIQQSLLVSVYAH